jgi:hypothetical protein
LSLSFSVRSMNTFFTLATSVAPSPEQKSNMNFCPSYPNYTKLFFGTFQIAITY